MQHREPTIQDVLDTLSVFSSAVDRRFEQIDRRFDEIREDFGAITRKTNTKLTVLVDSLVAENALDAKTAKRILALEPYSQI
jgi:hypothetical protein